VTLKGKYRDLKTAATLQKEEFQLKILKSGG
jgi:hypothetical protein